MATAVQVSIAGAAEALSGDKAEATSGTKSEGDKPGLTPGGAARLRRAAKNVQHANGAVHSFRAVSIREYTELHNDETIRYMHYDPEEKRAATAPGRAAQVLGKVEELYKKAHVVVQALTVGLAVLLTYSIATRGHTLGANLGQATVNTLAGLVMPHLAAPVGAGAYAGMVSALPSYGWVTFLAVNTSISWFLVSRWKLMVGYSGRLGTTAFVPCFFTVMICCGANDAQWDVYYRSGNWDDLTTERCLVTVMAVALAAILTRLVSTHVGVFPNLANPVSAGSAVALVAMLCVDVTDYRYKNAILSGIGQGTFTGMASVQRLSLWQVAAAGLIGGGLALLIHPFFNGFGGKQGFTAFLSCLPFIASEAIRAKLKGAAPTA